jgi:hypothetical protein
VRIALFCLVLSVTGCGYDFESYLSDDELDASAEDSAATDSVVAVDSGSPDDTGDDTGTAMPDTMVIDTAMADTMVVDTAMPDTAMPDTMIVDTAPDAVACTDAEGRVFGGHCYFPVGPTNWNNARTICLGRTAHLVTITTAAEEAFVETMRPGIDRWIGLRRVGAAAFTWTTGEAIGYTKWAPGEPNGSGECARLRNTNEWADQNCNSTEVAICERD